MSNQIPPLSAVSYRQGDTPIALPGLAVVGVKLIGLYTLAIALPQLMYFPFYLLNPGMTARYMLIGALAPAAYAGVGAALIWNAEWIVSRIMRVSQGDAPPVTATEHFQGVAFSIVGVVLMVRALIGAMEVVVAFAITEGVRGGGAVVSDMPLSRFAGPVVEVAAGLYLFLRGPGVAALWHRMRYGGVRVRDAG
jgi:hypothetical protein